MQTYRQASIVNLPQLLGSKLCPFLAFQNLIKKHPLNPQQPLLAYVVSKKLILFSKNQLQTMLRLAVSRANLHPQITFHALRRSSASLAFSNGVPLKHIQAHGTWASNAVWSYIDASAKSALLPKFFKSAVSTTPTASVGFG
jgi:integrase